MPRELSNVSDIATEKQNTPGQKDPILTIQPKDGTGIVIQGMVETGSAKGFPLYGKFYDTNGNPLPLDTELSFRFERPGDDDPTTVTFPLSNIRPYRTLSIDEQQDAEKVDAVKHVIKGTKDALAQGEMPRIGIGHLDKLHLTALSSKQIDWGHPQTAVYFDRNAVEEV